MKGYGRQARGYQPNDNSKIETGNHGELAPIEDANRPWGQSETEGGRSMVKTKVICPVSKN